VAGLISLFDDRGEAEEWNNTWRSSDYIIELTFVIYSPDTTRQKPFIFLVNAVCLHDRKKALSCIVWPSRHFKDASALFLISPTCTASLAFFTETPVWQSGIQYINLLSSSSVVKPRKCSRMASRPPRRKARSLLHSKTDWTRAEART